MNNNINQEVNSLMIIEGLKLDRVQQSMDNIQKFQEVIQKTLVSGLDHGFSFSGQTKPSLLKPGAEKILMLLGLSSEYEVTEQIQDYDNGFFAYTVKCTLTRGGQVITNGLGHCNSKEKKYTSEKQDIFMLGNTCLKMAKKRAQVDAALTVGSLSNIFTQDTEDMEQFNNSERMDTMTLDDAKNMKVKFGKYGKDGGTTLGEIFEIDKSYIEWLSNNGRDEAMKKACAMLLNPPKAVDKNPVRQTAGETLTKHHPDAYPGDVDPETGEILDGPLPWDEKYED